MNDIFEPLVLSRGSHQAGSGKGCAMNVISWENGDTEITDFPECSDQTLARLVQQVNDTLADNHTGLLSPENSLLVLELGHATVGTALRKTTYSQYMELIHSCLLGVLKGQQMDPGTVEDFVNYTPSWALTEAAHYLAGRWINNSPEYTARLIDMTRDFITTFKEMTGTTSPTPDPEATACALRKMAFTA